MPKPPRKLTDLGVRSDRVVTLCTGLQVNAAEAAAAAQWLGIAQRARPVVINGRDQQGNVVQRSWDWPSVRRELERMTEEDVDLAELSRGVERPRMKPELVDMTTQYALVLANGEPNRGVLEVFTAALLRAQTTGSLAFDDLDALLLR